MFQDFVAAGYHLEKMKIEPEMRMHLVCFFLVLEVVSLHSGGIDDRPSQ